MRILEKCLVVFFCVVIEFSGFSAEKVWMTDFQEAKKVAVNKKLPLLVYFTGSDWCKWCVKLHEEVLDKQNFKDYLKKNFVAVMIDFPMYREQSVSLKKSNQDLKIQYGVQGFPTLLVLNPEGKILARSNYIPGGVDSVIRYLTLAKARMR